VSRQSRSFTVVNAIQCGRRVGSTIVRRLVALPLALVALTVVGAGCRHDGREMRPALPSQNGSVSTSAAPTTHAFPTDGGAFFDTAETDQQSTPVTDSSPTTSSTSTTSTTTTVAAAFVITAPWRDGAPIDARYTCKGANVAPALSWTTAPEGTQEIAITMIDQDATFDHWTMAGIDPTLTGLAENQAPPAAVVLTTAHFTFYSDLSTNVHDALIAVATARRSNRPHPFSAARQFPVESVRDHVSTPSIRSFQLPRRSAYFANLGSLIHSG
jgi:hypothetical protein